MPRLVLRLAANNVLFPPGEIKGRISLMTLFNIGNDKVTQLKEKKFDLERDVQGLTEKNLEAIYGLQFIATEFERNALRIDTLAFDKESNAFVIIEYKRDRSFSIVDQGYAYLALLLNNKAEFVLEYNEKTNKTLRRDDVDWSQSRVIFVANSFTIHQRQAINFRDLPIELWEVQKYENNLISFNQLKVDKTSASIKTVTKNDTIQSVSKEVKVYTVEDHFIGAKGNVLGLYEIFRDRLQSYEPSIQENPRGNYIGFALGQNGNDTLVYVHPRSTNITLNIPRIRPEDITDPLSKLVYKKNSFESKNTPESIFIIESEDDIDYALSLLKQVRHTKHRL